MKRSRRIRLFVPLAVCAVITGAIAVAMDGVTLGAASPSATNPAAAR